MTDKKETCGNFLTAVMTAGLFLLTACAGEETPAAAMHLRRAQGTVSVSDGDGKDVPLLDNLGLYSGYGCTGGYTGPGSLRRSRR